MRRRADPLQIDLSSCLDPDQQSRKPRRRDPLATPAQPPRPPDAPAEMPRDDQDEQQARDTANTRPQQDAGIDVDVDRAPDRPSPSSPDPDVL